MIRLWLTWSNALNTWSYWHILGWCLYFRYDLEWWRRGMTCRLLTTWFYTRSYCHSYDVCTSGIMMIWWCRRSTRWLLITRFYTWSYLHILGWCLYFRYDLEWWCRRSTRWLLITWFYTRSYWHILGWCLYFRYDI
jgi:hypothetical protein